MRNKNNLLSVYAIIIIALITQLPLKTNGQTFYPAVSPDIQIGSSQSGSGVKNTGCAISPNSLTITNMKVFVWDGNTPQFAWSYLYHGITFQSSIPIIGVSGAGAITDPDVVLTADGLNALIIYIQNNKCYYESKKWNGSVFVVNQAATQLSTTGSIASCPNIDLAYNGIYNFTAATWTELSSGIGKVKGRVGRFVGTSFSFGYSTVQISDPLINSITPDVCISTNITGSTNLAYVTYTYISCTGTGIGAIQSLYYRQDSWVNLYSGITSGAPILRYQVNYPNQIIYPRIAAPIRFTTNVQSNPAPFYTDFEIVVANTPPSNKDVYKIIGFNKYQDVDKPPVEINSSPNIQSGYNGSPVVTYGHDPAKNFITVAWVYGGVLTGISGGTPNEIISIRLFDKNCVGAAYNALNGTVYYNPLVTPTPPLFYSLVNKGLSNNDCVPSIASEENSYVLYLWNDIATNSPYLSNLYYKTTMIGAENLRLASTENAIENDDHSGINIYPNPVSDNVYINLGNDNNMAGSEIEILNIGGQVVKKVVITNNNTAIDVKDLDNGLYFIKLKSADDVILKKLLVSH